MQSLWWRSIYCKPVVVHMKSCCLFWPEWLTEKAWWCELCGEIEWNWLLWPVALWRRVRESTCGIDWYCMVCCVWSRLATYTCLHVINGFHDIWWLQVAKESDDERSDMQDCTLAMHLCFQHIWITVENTVYVLVGDLYSWDSRDMRPKVCAWHTWRAHERHLLMEIHLLPHRHVV